jgi:hypothetical protein
MPALELKKLGYFDPPPKGSTAKPKLAGNLLGAVFTVSADGRRQINPESQRELQRSISRVLNNAPTGITTAQKQLALLAVLEKLTENLPRDCQAQNSVAVLATLLLGPTLLAAITEKAAHEYEDPH